MPLGMPRKAVGRIVVSQLISQMWRMQIMTGSIDHHAIGSGWCQSSQIMMPRSINDDSQLISPHANFKESKCNLKVDGNGIRNSVWSKLKVHMMEEN